MGLRTITGKKLPVNYSLDRQTGVKDPQVILYDGGKAQTRIRCANLVAVTGITDPTVIEQVTAYAADNRMTPRGPRSPGARMAPSCLVMGAESIRHGFILPSALCRHGLILDSECLRHGTWFRYETSANGHDGAMTEP